MGISLNRLKLNPYRTSQIFLEVDLGKLIRNPIQIQIHHFVEHNWKQPIVCRMLRMFGHVGNYLENESK